MRRWNPGGAVRAMTLIALAVATTIGLATVAHAAKAKSTTGTVYAGVTHAEGKDLYVSGDLKDELLGRGAIVYVTRLGGTDEPGSFLVKARKLTIYTTKGTLTGTGQATQTIHPDGSTTVTDGTFDLTKGTGQYKGHTLEGTFDGTYDEGVYTFDYEGKFK